MTQTTTYFNQKAVLGGIPTNAYGELIITDIKNIQQWPLIIIMCVPANRIANKRKDAVTQEVTKQLAESPEGKKMSRQEKDKR